MLSPKFNSNSKFKTIIPYEFSVVGTNFATFCPLVACFSDRIAFRIFYTFPIDQNTFTKWILQIFIDKKRDDVQDI